MVKLECVKSSISVLVNTRNEEEYLPRVLSSVKGFADEIIVVDMESTDRSAAIAKSLGAKVISHKFVSYVEPTRNFAIAKASGPWILILDPDEEIPSTLAKRLKEIAVSSKPDDASFYRLPRKNIIFGKWVKSSRWWPDNLIRFFRKGSVSWTEVIHGEPIATGMGVDLEAREDLAIIHHHYDSIEKFLLWSNRYADARTLNLLKNGYQFTWPDLLRKPVGEFLSRFFFGEGYKDGVHGLVLALLQGYAELLVYAKSWEKEGFPEQSLTLDEVKVEMQHAEKELNYWLADRALKEEVNPIKKLYHRAVRKSSS